MAIFLSPIRSETVSDKVVGQLLSLIQSGQLQVGDRLPGERQLCQTLRVSRMPIREALSTLKGLGVIEVRPGVGATIKRSVTSALASDIWMRWLSEHKGQILHVYEVREAIECQAARLAAQRCTLQHVQRLEEFIRQMESAATANDLAHLPEIDRAYHEYLASMSGNELLLQFLVAINEISTVYRVATYSLPGRPSDSLEEHRAILRAVQSGDSALASQAAASHTERIMELVAHLQLDDATARGQTGAVGLRPIPPAPTD